jgi:hypothetical protein
MQYTMNITLVESGSTQPFNEINDYALADNFATPGSETVPFPI